VLSSYNLADSGFAATNCAILLRLLLSQALARRLLFPARTHGHVPAAALAALHPDAARSDFNIVSVVINTDHGLMPAGIVEARDRKPAHAELAHVGEGHRMAGRSALQELTLQLDRPFKQPADRDRPGNSPPFGPHIEFVAQVLWNASADQWVLAGRGPVEFAL